MDQNDASFRNVATSGNWIFFPIAPPTIRKSSAVRIDMPTVAPLAIGFAGSFQHRRFQCQDFFDLFTQPPIGRIIFHALVPVQVGFQTGSGEREGMYLVHRSGVQQSRMSLRQGQ